MQLAGAQDPTGIVIDAVAGVGDSAFDRIADGIASWVLGGVEFFVRGAVDFLRTSSSPDVGAAWFSGTNSPYAAVRKVAAFLLVGFVFLGIIQGLINGDTAGMIRRVAANLPAAIAGMIVTTAVVGQLLALTDAMSNAVLVNTDDQALRFLSGFGAAATKVTSGFAAALLGFVAVIAGLVLWIELIVRASLVYILVAVSPLGFAATLWPSAKGILRKMVELLLAVIVSKLVICIALVVGVAAFSGAGTAGADGAGFGSHADASVGALLVGAVLLGLAAFSPFIVLKLFPVAEAALVAQGVSRGPWRTAQSGMSTAYSASMLTRIAGGGAAGAPASPSGSGSADPSATTTPASGGSTNRRADGTSAGGGASATGTSTAGGGAAVVTAAAQKARKGVAGTVTSIADNTAGIGPSSGSPRTDRDNP